MNKSGLGTRLAVVGVCLAGLIYVVNFVIEWKPVEQPVIRTVWVVVISKASMRGE